MTFLVKVCFFTKQWISLPGRQNRSGSYCAAASTSCDANEAAVESASMHRTGQVKSTTNAHTSLHPTLRGERYNIRLLPAALRAAQAAGI